MNEDTLRVLVVDRERRYIAAITRALRQVDGQRYCIDPLANCHDAARPLRERTCDVAFVDHRTFA